MEIREMTSRALSASLAEIPDPPTRLFVRGRAAPAGTKHLAVVGSRALTSYGKDAANKLIAGLSGYPISIVSGLALGADAAAHRAALSHGLHTIAVLGSGVDDASVYPRSNAGLAEDILEAGGMLISEREAGYKPQAFDFPLRNRIVVGLSDAVLIVEAGERSGTLITARLAGEYNRELLCVPHRIGDTHAYGAELFLRLGATLVAKSEHILEALGLAPRETGTIVEPKLEGVERKIYELLVEPADRDQLVRSSGMSVSETITTLITLELKGLAKEEFGLWRRI